MHVQKAVLGNEADCEQLERELPLADGNSQSRVHMHQAITAHSFADGSVSGSIMRSITMRRGGAKTH